MKRVALTVLIGLGLGACQLVTVPSGACFQGEACANDGGSGGGAGGGSGGGSAGGQGGGGVVVDAGPEVPNFFRDAGICEDWACVASKLAPPGLVPPSFQEIDLPVPLPPPSTSCGPNWSGGVLLPDGRVLAIPSCASRFLLIDVVARRADLVGPQLNTPASPDFESGVLGCDGRVYAMPAFQGQIARIDVTPGTLDAAVTVFDFGFALKLRGAVVAQRCDQGLVIAGIGHDVVGVRAVAERLHVRENGAELSTFPIAQVQDLAGGAVRLGDDSVWLGAAASEGGLGKHFFTRFDPNDGGVAMLPATDPVTGFDIFPVGLAVSGAGGAVFIEESATAYELVLDAGAPLGVSVAPLESNLVGEPHVRWPAARGDGFVYTSGAAVIAISDRDGGHSVLFDQLFDGGSANEMEGLVVTFDGSLVGIPGSDSTVRLFVKQNGGGVPAPPEVLLSPFFNKL